MVRLPGFSIFPTFCSPTLDLCEPVRLVVMLRGNGEGVEKDKDQDHPVERDRFDSQTAFLPEEAVHASHSPAVAGRKGQELLKMSA